MSACLDIVDASFVRLVLPNAPLEKLGEGFGWLEGPVWFADHEMLLFSDVPNDRVMRWTRSGGISVFRAPSHFENGHARDEVGRLISCSHHGWVSRTEFDGSVTILVDRFMSKRLNSPNDVIVKSDGTIWFSDPPFGISSDYEGGKREAELPAHLYRFDPKHGTLHLVADDIAGPNGLAFSPNEDRLYVAETGRQFDQSAHRCIRMFDVVDNGHRLSHGREFHRIEPGYCDGLRVDEDGRVWSSAADGVHCIDPSGNLLGKIKVPFTVSNLVFGGRNRAQLFICASHTLFGIYTNTRGATRP